MPYCHPLQAKQPWFCQPAFAALCSRANISHHIITLQNSSTLKSKEQVSQLVTAGPEVFLHTFLTLNSGLLYTVFACPWQFYTTVVQTSGALAAAAAA